VGKGGSSSSETVTVTSTDTGTIDIVGLDDVDVTLNVPDPITTNATSTLLVPDPITTNATVTTTSTLLVPDPIQNDVGLTLDVKPLETTIDVKPLVLDLCTTVNIGRIPETRVRNPYRHHIGLTVFGTEVFGMTFEGEQDIVVEDLHRQPVVVESAEYLEHEHRGERRRHGGDGLQIRVGP
jgi:hypothetical protein